MNVYSVKYGKREEDFQLPADCKVNFVQAKPTQAIVDYKTEILNVLKNPVNSPSFYDSFKKDELVAIVVSDYTRASYNFYKFLPILLDELNKQGISDQNISIIMSTGDHREQTREQHLLVVGEEVLSRVKIYDHDCMAHDLVDLGTTSRGTKVLMNRMVYEADKVIITGGIAYHLLAGFGGGRKSIAPGVSGYQTIQENHGLALKLHEGEFLGCGSLDNNPVAQDMNEITRVPLYQTMQENIGTWPSTTREQTRYRCPFIESGAGAIIWDGNLSPCLPLMHSHTDYLGFLRFEERYSKRWAIGNIMEKSLLDLWNTPEHLAFRERVQAFSFATCTTCAGCDLSESNEEDCINNTFPTCGGCLWAQGVIRCP